LRDALRDSDRRVRTEALRSLVLYDDDASYAAILNALDSPDTWISTSAADSMHLFPNRAATSAPRLLAATRPDRPLALRIVALRPLIALAPESALEPATALARDTTSVVARMAGMQALQRLGPAGRARLDSINAAAGAPAQQGQQGQQGRQNTMPVRPASDYRALVERFIVPEYNGAARPRVALEFPRGTIEIELNAGDAPLGTEFMFRVIESGDIVGTEFGRVVPNFVAQQRTIRNAVVLRDEITRLGLTRLNLSWASGGLDTGRPGYTLGTTPQPHNEGDFTTLGRVVRGADVMDRLDLADRVVSARVVRFAER
jgi:cyclophilin family peptidyl-prolyl cis-trans isomerase